MNNSSIHTKNLIFPVIVAILSLMNIYKHLSDLQSLSVLLSLVGIAGVIFYLTNNPSYRPLIYLWIIPQMFIINKSVLDQSSGVWTSSPIFDLSQFISLFFGARMGTETTQYGFNINIVPFAYFILLKLLDMSMLIGKRLTFYKFREENALGDIFPITGTVTQNLKLWNEKNWILVNIDEAFEFDGKIIEYVLVKEKGGGLIRKNVKNQLVYFRLVEDIKDIEMENTNTEKFPFIDWMICK